MKGDKCPRRRQSHRALKDKWGSSTQPQGAERLYLFGFPSSCLWSYETAYILLEQYIIP